MLRTLLESQAAPGRSAGGTAVSVGVHTAVIALAIVATARASSAPPRIGPDMTEVVYTPPPPGARVDQRVPDRGQVPIPRRYTIARHFLVPPIDVPQRLPSTDFTTLPRPDDFANGGSMRLARERAGDDPGTGGPIGGAYTATMVEKAAAPRQGNPAPVYPPSLRFAQLEGSVVARFVVDTTGRAEPASIQFPEASHPAFAEAVRQSLLRSRYLPAMIAGHTVRQLVEQRFSFSLSR